MSLQPTRLAEEGNPVAAILLFWYVLAIVVEFSSALSSTVGDAGIVMAGAYVVVRGASLSSEVPSLETEGVEAVLYENARVALSASIWFLAAAPVYAIHQSYIYSDIVGAIAGALAGAGLGVVGLYAVAVGVATFDGRARDDAFGRRRDAGDSDDGTPADD